MINSPVQKIKERLSIEDIVSSYIKLEKAGKNLKANCPFHNEKTPSFFVSPDRDSYYCFGCGAKGDIFTFVEEFEGLDFKGALKILAGKAGVILEQFNREEESEKERLYRAMEESAKFFSENLSKNNLVLEYLKSRGLKDETIKDFRIGFIKDDLRELYNHLKSKNFSDREIELAGLAKKSEKGFYDRFRSRIMFPINDSSGRIIAFSGRYFSAGGQAVINSTPEPSKYLNSPETPIFSKSSVLYGLDKAKESIRKNNFSILVEGQFDLVLSHQAGFRNTVATSGTALTDATVSKENLVSNLGLIRRLSGNIVLAFDADKAGINASTRASKIALSLDMDVKVASLPEGIDPADLISRGHSQMGEAKSGPEAWHEAIRNSKHIIEFLLAKILADNTKNDGRYIGREIKERILPYVDSINSAIEKSHFIKLISDKSQIPEEALKSDLKKVGEEQKSDKNETEKVKEEELKMFRKDYILRKLLGIILWQKTLKVETLDTESLLKEITEILKINPDEFLEKNKENKEDLIFEAEVFYAEDTDFKKDILELLNNLKIEYLSEELSGKMQELNNAETEKDRDKSSKILQEISEINSKMEDLKNGRLNKKI
jgi:DNA primase